MVTVLTGWVDDIYHIEDTPVNFLRDSFLRIEEYEVVSVCAVPYDYIEKEEISYNIYQEVKKFRFFVTITYRRIPTN